VASKNDLQKILDQIEALTGKKITLNLDTKGPEELAQLLDTYEEKLNNARKQSSLFNMSLQETRDISKSIVQEMTKQNKTVQAAKAAMNGLTSIATELLNEEREISSISQKRLSTLLEQAKLRKQSLEDQAAYLKRDNESTSEAIKRLKTESDNLNLRTRSGKQRAAEIANEKTILRAALDQEGVYESIVKTAEKRLKLEQATTATFGLTGAALSAASSIASKFGMSHISEQLDEIQEQLNSDIRKAVEENDGKALSFGKRFQFASKAIGQTAAVLMKGMLDPLFIIRKIFTAFLDVNKAAVEYTRLTGVNAVAMSTVNSQLATSVEFLETAADLTKQTGMAASAIYAPTDIARIAEAKNLLGLSSEEAGKLAERSATTKRGVEGYEKGIVKATNSFNRANRSALAHGAVMKEVLNTSDSISLSLGSNPEKITEAASAAMQLGLNLEKVDAIAGSLMNFEDSISNELEAELLTGKDINLEKARELAMNNDLAGLSQELAKNGASAAEFGKMNRLQQESLAKALGMSREELAKSAQLELLRSGASKEAIEAAGSMTLEQLQQVSIQERLNKTLDKLAQAFSPILEAIIPIAEALISIIQPIASVIGHISSGIGGIIGPLLTVFGIFKGIQLVNQGILAANTAMVGVQATITAMKASELGTLGGILTAMGLQNAFGAFRLAQETEMGFLAGARAVMEETTLGTMLLQGGAMIKNIAVGAVRLAQSLATAAAELMGVSAMTLGIGTAIAVGAAVAGFAVLKSMKDGVIDPNKGPVVSGEFGSVQLDKNDQVVAGTDLYGDRKKEPTGTISQASVDMSPVVSELAALRTEMSSIMNKILAKEGTVYMDSNKVGRAHVIGSYKSA
jgi:hypothetical protein